jgi:pre-mRNA-splicing factor CWC26
MEWGKGLVQKQQRDEKLKEDLYEADKPLARLKDDKDLDKLLKNVEREDDPMLEYLRSKKEGNLDEDGMIVVKTKATYKGPPPPLNRYNILPGSRWDGVDRSNGFEKRYYESIAKKKAIQEEAYKWSTEDM